MLPQLCQKTIISFSTVVPMLDFLWIKGGVMLMQPTSRFLAKCSLAFPNNSRTGNARVLGASITLQIQGPRGKRSRSCYIRHTSEKYLCWGKHLGSCGAGWAGKKKSSVFASFSSSRQKSTGITMLNWLFPSLNIPSSKCCLWTAINADVSPG